MALLYQVDQGIFTREDNIDDQLRKGTWLEEEDERLTYFVQLMGDKKWDSLAKASGLRRSGKSCRLRWLNYLRPNLKHGHISVEEENIILQLHEKWGNKWSKIARKLPGRTDNEIKNFWRTHLRRKVVEIAQESDQVVKKAKQELYLYEDKNESSTNNSKKYDNYKCEAQDHDHDHRNSSLDDQEFLGDSSESSGISVDFALTISPYENRFSDWISEYSNNNSDEMNYQNEYSCVTLESSISSDYNLQCWTSSGRDYSDSWDTSCSLWDMN